MLTQATFSGDKERTNVLMHAARIANVEITGMVLDKIKEVERHDASKVKVVKFQNVKFI